MAVVSPSSPQTLEPKPDKSEAQNPPSISQDPSPLPPPASAPSSTPIAASVPSENPNPNPNPITPPPPSVPSFVPSFRPLGPPHVPQFSTYANPNPNPNFQNPNFQNPGIHPPGVSIMLPGAANGAGAVTVSVSNMQSYNNHGGIYHSAPGQHHNAAPVPYGQVQNGYMTMHAPSQQGLPMIAPPGIPRYPAPYSTMVRPGFPPRPPAPIGVIPQLSRPPIPGIRGVPPIVTPMVRPVLPIVAPTEKPQTTVYIGKIAPTVDNEFMLSLLRLCGPVKSWKRAQDPTDGSPKGFGFCEFESAEGVLRALRLLSKFNVDGQELVLNINQATREYLERYVEKKTEREKLKETEAEGAEKESGSVTGAEKQEVPKPVVELTKKDGEDSGDKENQENTQKFGIVTDEDRDADRDALEKITNMIEERLKTRPLPPPPPVPTSADAPSKSNSEIPSKSRDGDSDVDIMKSDAADEKNDDDTTSENKPATEHDRPETSSSDKARRHDRSRERDRDRDLKREKERELERYERERERERVRRERDRDIKMREAERLYKDRVKEWEAREREKDYQRQYEKEREKERERERQREIADQADESDDDDTRKRRRRSSAFEEKRRKRQREKGEDLADKLKEEEEIAEAKRRAIEEQPQKDDLNPLSDQVINGSEIAVMQEEGMIVEVTENAVDQAYESDPGNGNTAGEAYTRNESGDELILGSAEGSEMKQNNSAPIRKLGFGLIGSGKRTTVPSVFHEEDDEDVDKEKKMRPLVPIDYSTEELQAVQATVSGAPPNLVAAAEFAKRISSVNSKEEKLEVEKEKNRRSNDRNDRMSQRERDRNDEENTRGRDESKEKMHDRFTDRGRDREDKVKTENKKLLDAKQLIDMIPKTKEELFAYEINWAVYDKHVLHERMRPWISKKITEFLGEEEVTLVDYIVSSTNDHVRASQMLELLQSIFDDEAEMFVLKMWRMLIFEIKKVETGLSKSRA